MNNDKNKKEFTTTRRAGDVARLMAEAAQRKKFTAALRVAVQKDHFAEE